MKEEFTKNSKTENFLIALKKKLRQTALKVHFGLDLVVAELYLKRLLSNRKQLNRVPIEQKVRGITLYTLTKEASSQNVTNCH